jgi:hypothetical protein
MAIIRSHSRCNSILAETVIETVIFLIVNEEHEQFWRYIQKELLQIKNNIRCIIINKRYPLTDYGQDLPININEEEYKFMLRFRELGIVFTLENHEYHKLCDPDREYNCLTVNDCEKIARQGVSPGEVLRLLKIYNYIYSEKCFYLEEFNYNSLSVDTLTNAINSDLNGAIGHDLKTEDINEILTIPDLFDKYQKIKPDMHYSEYVMNLVKVTEEIRKEDVMDLDEHSQSWIECINRLLIEEIYPDLSPKMSSRELAFSNYESEYYFFIEIDESPYEELDDVLKTIEDLFYIRETISSLAFYHSQESFKVAGDLYYKYKWLKLFSAGDCTLPQDEAMGQFLYQQEIKKYHNIDRTIRDLTKKITNTIKVDLLVKQISLVTVTNLSWMTELSKYSAFNIYGDLHSGIIDHHEYFKLEKGLKHIHDFPTDVFVVEEAMPDGNILDLIPEIVKGDAQTTKIIVLIKERSTKSDEVANMYKQVRCVEFSYNDSGLSQETANNIREVIRTVFDEKNRAAQNSALRDRKDDIPELAEDFVKKYSAKENRHLKLINPDTLEYLINYDWPLDVQELEDIINIAYETADAADSKEIDPHHLPDKVRFYDPSAKSDVANIDIADEKNSIAEDPTYNGLIKKGAYWDVTFMGRNDGIKDSKGLLSIAIIIQTNGKPISSGNLAQIINGNIVERNEKEALANDLNIKTSEYTIDEEILNGLTKKDIINFLNNITDQIINEENLEEKMILEEKLSSFINQSKGTGIKITKGENGYSVESRMGKIGGRESARKATSGNIKNTIKTIREKYHWKELADYLENTIITGSSNRYSGDLKWDINFNL